MKSITRRNEKFGKPEFLELQRRFGGPYELSRALGVAYATLYRWREGQLRVTRSRELALWRLYHSTRSPFQELRTK